MVGDLISYAAAYVSGSEYSDETKSMTTRIFWEDSVDADLACGKICLRRATKRRVRMVERSSTEPLDVM